MGIHASGYTYTPQEAQPNTPWIPTPFATSKLSRCIKVYDIYPLAERAFNFPNMAFFRPSSKLVQKKFGNISEINFL